MDVVSHLAVPGLAAHLGNRRPVLCLLEHKRDLRLAEHTSLHHSLRSLALRAITGIFQLRTVQETGCRSLRAGLYFSLEEIKGIRPLAGTFGQKLNKTLTHRMVGL